MGRWAKRWCPVRRPRVLAATAVAALSSSPASAKISRTGFRNSYYQGLDYNGSRVLEQLVENRYEEYIEVTWTQSVSVDSLGRVWVVDRNEHVLVMMQPSTRYIPWAALYEDYSGVRGAPGFNNGSRKQAKFDSPTGIALSSASDSKKKFSIYISDTNNHVIRRVDYELGRVVTVVGSPGVPGWQDGMSMNSRLTYPGSLGLDSAGDNLMVLDGGRTIRRIQVSLKVPSIVTLVSGACRSISRQTLLTSIELRRVGCHTDWLLTDIPNAGSDMTEHFKMTFCLGHQATCGERHHPALQDRFSPQLNMQPTTTTTTTKRLSAADF